MPIAPEEWRCLGTVTFHNGKPVFPEDPTNPSKAVVPGIYRLTFDNEYIYIGQTKRMRERFNEYCAPAPGVELEHVIHYILLDAGGAKVEVFTDLPGKVGEGPRALETAAKKDAIAKKLLLLNDKRGLGHRHYLRFRIKYHEKMLCKSLADLEALESSSE